MRKKLVVMTLAAVMAVSAAYPAAFNAVPVMAEDSKVTEDSIIGTWYSNVWGTPTTMTVEEKNCTIKYDNDEGTELSGEWSLDGNQVTVSQSDGDDLVFVYDEKADSLTNDSDGEEFVFTHDEENSVKKTVATAKNVKEKDFDGVWKASKVETDSVLAPANIFGVNNLFLSVKNGKVGLYLDIDSTDGIVDVSDLSSSFSDEKLTFTIGGDLMSIDGSDDDDSADNTEDASEEKDADSSKNEEGDGTDSEASGEDSEYEDISCSAEMLEDGTMRLHFSDSIEVAFIMEKSSKKELKAAKEEASSVDDSSEYSMDDTELADEAFDGMDGVTSDEGEE